MLYDKLLAMHKMLYEAHVKNNIIEISFRLTDLLKEVATVDDIQRIAASSYKNRVQVPHFPAPNERNGALFVSRGAIDELENSELTDTIRSNIVTTLEAFALTYCLPLNEFVLVDHHNRDRLKEILFAYGMSPNLLF